MTKARTILSAAVSLMISTACAAPTGSGDDALRGQGCTLTASEWQGRAWPVDRLVLGGRIYDRGALSALLGGSDEDASVVLGRELAAAELNAAAGAEPADWTLREGHAWLTGGRTPLPHGVSPASEPGRVGLRIASDLAAYNAGDVGPGACER